MRNAQFWASHIRATYLDQLSTFRDVALNRVLPSLPDIDVDKAYTEAGERLSKSPDLACDPGDVADRALDEAIDRYVMRMWVRQGITNLLAVGLHHLVEQQQLHLLRRELLCSSDEDNHDFLKVKEFYKRSSDCGVCPGDFADWAKLAELASVANAVKHAEGRSAAKLRNVRPDLFQPPKSRDALGAGLPSPNSSIYQPLFGEGIFVSETDLALYCQAAEGFWQEYAERLLNLPRIVT